MTDLSDSTYADPGEELGEPLRQLTLDEAIKVVAEWIVPNHFATPQHVDRAWRLILEELDAA